MTERYNSVTGMEAPRRRCNRDEMRRKLREKS